MSEIERRVSSLEQLAHSFHASDTDRIAESRRNAAGYMALHSMVAEIAEQHGISDPDFLRHWEMRKRYFYDHYTAQVAEMSPGLAEEIDERPANAATFRDGFPPLFPQPPQQT